MKRILLILHALLLLPLYCFSQTGQLSIDRIDMMPDMPSPYVMKNWKEVAVQYDEFIFDRDKTGQHLPLIGLKPIGNNYPELQPILLKTYVGSQDAAQAEAINIIPAIVSASLMGIDKSTQMGTNWVIKTKDFYNNKNNEDVYLNGYDAFSGNDWWYDLMPNVFFYQLYSLYPSSTGFEVQFISVADQWLKAIYAMGGKTTPWSIPQMNYRGWHLSSMTGNAGGVKEPESAGTIAWLLYNAYQQTNDEKYLEGAQMALDFLSALNANPSYELQLPYGTLTAAKLNAEAGANYPIDKMLGWSFDKGELRGWGTIIGSWDGKDVSGLVGEANDQGDDYAFLMNGFQQAAALAPMVKYDKRYAKAIAKWILNLANASRLFYPQHLDESKQDDFDWSNAFDPQSVIGYEALKENWEGEALYGTGDAKRSGWAATNLALYASSHAGYLAAIVDTTDVAGILKLDVNKTDFFGDHHFQSYLLYNPHAVDHQVTLHLGSNFYTVYEALSETDIAENVTGNIQAQVKAGEVIFLTYLPAGIEKSIIKNKLYGEGHIIDYHYGYNFEPIFGLKSLSIENNLLEFNRQTFVYAHIENAPAAVSYEWYVNDVFFTSTDEGILSWTTPETEGEYKIRVDIISGSEQLQDSIFITVLEYIPQIPVITAIEQDKKFYQAGSIAKLTCGVEGTEHLTYTWSVSSGTIETDDSLLIWTMPAVEGIYIARCLVKNDFDLTTEAEAKILVKYEDSGPTEPLAYYPLNINVNDYSGNDFHANIQGAQKAEDALGNTDLAFRFSSGEDIIYVDNEPLLNFQDAITLSFWVSAGFAGHEAFILSHGSWEERWKVSITSDRKVRWTVKTSEGIKDIDSSFPLAPDQYYHITVVYSSYSMEIYMNGMLDTYLPHNGMILTTNKPVTFGQKGLDETGFFLNGILDEVRIYDIALHPDEIVLLKSLWHEEYVTASEEWAGHQMKVFPNPSKDGICWIVHPSQQIKEVQVVDTRGLTHPVNVFSEGSMTKVVSDLYPTGLFFLKIILQNEMKTVKIIFN